MSKKLSKGPLVKFMPTLSLLVPSQAIDQG
jgi:hypothetical protein